MVQLHFSTNEEKNVLRLGVRGSSFVYISDCCITPANRPARSRARFWPGIHQPLVTCFISKISKPPPKYLHMCFHVSGLPPLGFCINNANQLPPIRIVLKSCSSDLRWFSPLQNQDGASVFAWKSFSPIHLISEYCIYGHRISTKNFAYSECVFYFVFVDQPVLQHDRLKKCKILRSEICLIYSIYCDKIKSSIHRLIFSAIYFL